MNTQFFYVENDLGDRYVYHARPPRFFAKIEETPEGDDLVVDTEIDEGSQSIVSKLHRARKWLAHYYATKNIKRWVKTKEN